MNQILDHLRSLPDTFGQTSAPPSPEEMSAPVRARRALTVLGFFVAVSVWHTWPLVRSPLTRLQEGRDVSAGMWSLTELVRQLMRDPQHLFNGNIYYPFPNTLAVLDHQLASALSAVPIAALGGGDALVYNAVIFSTFLLSGFFTYLLVRKITGSTAAGLVSGCAYAFSGSRVNHLMQAHLLVTQWLPLALLMMHRYFERPTWRRWSALAVVTFLVAVSSWHIAVIGAIGIGLVALWTMVGDGRDVWRRGTGLLLVAALCALALLPLASIYARMGDQWPPLTGEGRESMGTLADLSVDVAGLASPAARSTSPFRRLLTRSAWSRPGVFPGIVVVLLMLPALAMLRRSAAGLADGARKLTRWWLWITLGIVLAITLAAAAGERGEALVTLLRPLAPFVLLAQALALAGLLRVWRTADSAPEIALVLTYVALAVCGALLALGPRVFAGSADLGSGLWRFDLLPVRLIIRAPERLSLLLALGSSVLAGMGMARLSNHLSRRAAMTLAAVVLIALNIDLGFRMHSFKEIASPSAVDAWLAESPEPGATIEYPLIRNPGSIYRSQLYSRRIVNGKGYMMPSQLVQVEAQPDFSPEQLALLWEHFHPRFMVFRPEQYQHADPSRLLDTIESQPEALILRAHLDREYVFELFDRGRGQRLFRRWPFTALRGQQGLLLEGVLSAGREDTVGNLAVLLNDQVLLEASGSDVEIPFSRLVMFEPGQLVRGMNTFEIRADYRFAENAERNPVGTTGVGLAADVLIVSNRNRSRVEVNGRSLPVDKGYFLVVLDAATGAITETGQFDVSTDMRASEALVEFVRAIPAGSPVVVATEFDASRQLTREAVSALRDLGLEKTLRDRFGRAHAAIGVKGAPRGSALEETHRRGLTLELGQIDRREVQLFSSGLR